MSAQHTPGPWKVEPIWSKRRSLSQPPTYAVFRERPGTVDEWMRGASGRRLSFRSEGSANAAILHRMNANHDTGGAA